MKKLKYNFKIEDELNLALYLIITGCHLTYQSLNPDDNTISLFLLSQGFERMGKIALLADLKENENIRNLGHKIEDIVNTIENKGGKLKLDKVQRDFIKLLTDYANKGRYENLDNINNELKTENANIELNGKSKFRKDTYKDSWEELLRQNDKDEHIISTNETEQVLEANQNSYSSIVRKILNIANQLLIIAISKQEKPISQYYTNLLRNEKKLLSKFEETPCFSVFED